MDGLTITLAETWEQVEAYTDALGTCISPGKWNWTNAKDSWDQDRPRPVYLLLDCIYGKGYIRFLPVAGFLWSDYFKFVTSGVTPDASNLKREIWCEAVRFLGQPCLVNYGVYGGREIKWLGPPLSYKRVNSNAYSGASVWVLYPEDVGGIVKDFGPATSANEAPISSPVDC